MSERSIEPNPILMERLEGLTAQLLAAHRSGSLLSSATKGREREAFIHQFLEQVFPNTYRFGSGDITDTTHHRTGQLDLVMEFPFLPSFPAAPSSGMPRLYLAESVAAVIEVKSDLAGQWNEVAATNAKVSQLGIASSSIIALTGGRPRPQGVPVFAVGYTGWKSREKLLEYRNRDNIWATWIIDAGIFVGPAGQCVHPGGAALLFCDELMHCVQLNRMDSSEVAAYLFKNSRPSGV